MDLGGTFGFDAELADGGVDIKIDEDGATISVAAMPNTHFDRHMLPIIKRYRAMGKEVPESEYEEAFAKFVLLGWSKLTDEGKTLKPTEENRLMMLRKYPAFKTLVRNEAMTRANFQKRVAEAERKN